MRELAENYPQYDSYELITLEVVETKSLRWFECTKCDKQFSVLESLALNLCAECPACGSFWTKEENI